MAKILYFDAVNGVAGDMILGGLLDLGLPEDHLVSELKKLPLAPWRIEAGKISREGLSGTNLQVFPEKPDEEKAPQGGHAGNHHHHHHHHHFTQIRDMILASPLDEWVKKSSVAIFTRLAEAEAKVHKSSIDEVHFHEVGAIDAIIDIVGSCIGFRYFGIETFGSSPMELGGGTVTFSHGTWPVPAPATAELIKEFPITIGAVQAEMTTPTGAAIVTTLVSPQGISGSFRIKETGLGAGDRELQGIPNMLRLILGESEAETKESPAGKPRDRIVVLEANIDDMMPEDLGYVLEEALKRGALDLFYTPVYMKKNRPAVQLTLLAEEEQEKQLVEFLFSETSSLGIRRRVSERHILERETVILETEFGNVRFKKAVINGSNTRLTPEYEELKRIAGEHNLSLGEVRSKLIKR